ncbi:hypothetical protein JCM10213v2_008914 [Rhodosporidiobolus nylandii]
MADSPSAASLHALLSSSSALTPSSTRRSSRSPARQSQTVKAHSVSAGWGGTITAAFGYGTARDEAGRGAGVERGGKRKSSARAGLPDWGLPDSVEEGELGEGRRRSAAGREQSDRADEEKTREGGSDELDELAESILWQAGSDHASPPGPLLVIACSRIPSPTAVSHSALLDKLRSRLEAFASSGPYSVVLLVNSTQHAPATAQLVSSYLALTRQARKNVRRVFVVGGGWWTRVILTLFSTTLLSSKTPKRRKLAQCASLTALAAELGAEAFVQVEFPLEVYGANACTDPEIELPPSRSPLPRTFGVPLHELTGEDGDRLPSIVRDCVDVLLSQGPASVGIFRRSPSAAHVKLLRSAYDRGHPVSLSTLPDAPYLAASLLKLFLRELPSPIFPPSLYLAARACPRLDDLALPYIRTRILSTLSAPQLLMLQQLCAVLSAIAGVSEMNLMTSENLVVCLCPALIGGLGASREEVEMCRVPGMEVGSMRGLTERKDGGRNTLGGVLRVMIDHSESLFDESTLSSLAPSIRLPLISSELDLTRSRSPPLPLAPVRMSPSSLASSRSPSMHSVPRSPIASIPEDEAVDGGESTSLPASPTARPGNARGGMERSTSHSSFASTSSASSLPSLSSSSSPRSGALRVKKAGHGQGQGILLDSYAVPAGEGGEGEGVGMSGTVRKAKSRGVVTVQGVKGVFVGAAGTPAKEGDGGEA